MMKNVIITGGAGFLGSHLSLRLLDTPGVERVVVYDNCGLRTQSYVPCDRRAEWIHRSIAESDYLLSAMQGCDTVFHLASNADISKAATEPGTDFWHGTYLTHCVLEAARKEGVKRLFFTSGSGVYGDYGTTPVTEDMPCHPVSPYGAAKLGSEALISAYSAMFGIKASIFRFANVVGARQTHGVAYDFIRKLRANPKRLEILGNGQQSKSYIHVNDVLDAMMLVATRQEKWCDVWNVATSDSLTVKQIADLVIAAMSLVFSGLEVVAGTTPEGWKGDVPVVRFNTEKIRALGWRNRNTSAAAMYAAILEMVKE